MKCEVCKPSSDQRWQDELWFSTWRYVERYPFVYNHLLCYRPTIHNSISKICPKFHVLSSHFSEVEKLLNEHWANIVRIEIFSTPIYVECDKMYRSKVCDQEFWYILSGLDIQPEQSENNNPAGKSCPMLREITIHVPPFFMKSIQIFGSVIKASCSGSGAIRRRFAAALLPRLFGNNVPGHTTRAPPVGFELATNGIQFYAIANLDKTS